MCYLSDILGYSVNLPGHSSDIFYLLMTIVRHSRSLWDDIIIQNDIPVKKRLKELVKKKGIEKVTEKAV